MIDMIEIFLAGIGFGLLVTAFALAVGLSVYEIVSSLYEAWGDKTRARSIRIGALGNLSVDCVIYNDKDHRDDKSLRTSIRLIAKS